MCGFTRLYAVVELLPLADIVFGLLWCVKRIVLRVGLDARFLFAVVEGIVNRDIGFAKGIEVDRRHIVEFPDSLLDSRRQDLPDGLFVFKFDFRLCGMDVDVDIRGVDVEIDEERHLFALWHQSLIRATASMKEKLSSSATLWRTGIPTSHSSLAALILVLSSILQQPEAAGTKAVTEVK